MNIFYLDKDPVIAAQMSCDKHCIKMILESAQMLSTAHRVLDGDEYADSVGLYKMAHKNHPSTIWARSSSTMNLWQNYQLILILVISMLIHHNVCLKSVKVRTLYLHIRNTI